MSGVNEKHGDYGWAKNNGCTCERCRKRVRAYDNRRQLLIAAGRWQPYVDAQPVREHVRWLGEHGIGVARVRELAGVHSVTMQRLLYGHHGHPPSRHMRPQVAARILAVQPSLAALADGAQIDATGTRRRIQALARMGWNGTEVGRRIGVPQSQVSKMTREAKVYARSARKVAAVYRVLVQTPPPDTWVTRRTIAMAERKGWPGPIAWEDGMIDDPGAVPDVGGQRRRRRRGELVAEIADLRRRGLTTSEVADRLGVHLSTVQKTERRIQGQDRAA